MLVCAEWSRWIDGFKPSPTGGPTGGRELRRSLFCHRCQHRSEYGLGYRGGSQIAADYFCAPVKPTNSFGLFALPLTIARNLFGWLVILTGCVLMLPGVPGQGLLMILVGLTFADFPRKFELQKRIIKIPGLRSAADAVRVRFGRVPFQV